MVVGRWYILRWRSTRVDVWGIRYINVTTTWYTFSQLSWRSFHPRNWSGVVTFMPWPLSWCKIIAFISKISACEDYPLFVAGSTTTSRAKENRGFWHPCVFEINLLISFRDRPGLEPHSATPLLSSQGPDSPGPDATVGNPRRIKESGLNLAKHQVELVLKVVVKTFVETWSQNYHPRM